jgi:Putative zinc- or iron-chelating domain
MFVETREFRQRGIRVAPFSSLGANLIRIRLFRRMWQALERLPSFLAVIFSMDGLGSADGRTLIRGKFRRVALSFFPPVARYLQRYYGLEGGCQSCGASCKLLNQCVHWDETSRLCSVYEDRPNICRTFPITPADLRDRDLILKKIPCGFHFKTRE